MVFDSQEQAVILRTPVGEHIAEPVDLPVLFGHERKNAAKQTAVRQNVSQRIDFRTEMAWQIGTRVDVVLVFGQEIDVVKAVFVGWVF